MKQLAYKRLGYNSGDNTYKLTIPPEVIESNKYTVGMIFSFQENEGVLKYSALTKPGRKIKLQHSNVWYVRVPAIVVKHLGYEKGQQFEFISNKTGISYNPYEYGTRLIGVAKPKKTVDNITKYRQEKEQGGEVIETVH